MQTNLSLARRRGTYSLSRLLATLFILFLLSLTASGLYAQTRRGLHVTQEELNVWRQRMVSGPYKVAGDFQTNSPGDWDRITTSAEKFRTNPTSFRWNGPTAFVKDTVNGVIYTQAVSASASNNPPKTALGIAYADRIRDAAFLYLVDHNNANRVDLKAKIKQELVYEANVALLDLADTSGTAARYPKTKYQDGVPLYEMAAWFSEYLLALDYIDAADAEDGITTDWLGTTNRQKITSWFVNAAKFIQAEAEEGLNRQFTDRPTTNEDLLYTPKTGNFFDPSKAPSSRNGLTLTTHYSKNASGTPVAGYTVYPSMNFFNNRRMSDHRFAALTGVKFNNLTLKNTARRYVKDWLKYCIFPDGTNGELQRWDPTFPDDGWAYACITTGSAIGIADVLARDGDNNLYTFSTALGMNGTQGQVKNLRNVLLQFKKIVNQDLVWYGTNNAAHVPTNNLGKNTLIDMYDIQSDGTWEGLHDVTFVQANLYYNDATIKQLYTRTGTGMPTYPASPNGTGSFSPFQGEFGIYPGVLFMFGQMENSTANPYNNLCTASPTSGTILREYWANVPGTAVSDIPVTTTPTSTSSLTIFSIPTSNPNVDYFGDRIRGYICAPATGNYTFWVAGNNSVELWLSTDANPANKVKIAYTLSSTNPLEWKTAPAPQVSVSKALVAGRRYYIEALHKEGDNTDHIAVGWQLPDGTYERPIPGNRLSPYVPISGARLAIEEVVIEKNSRLLAHPNPFSDRVSIEFTTEQAEPASLNLYDMKGAFLGKLFDGTSEPGTANKVELNGSQLKSGLYVIRLVTPGKVSYRKLVLAK